MAILTITDLSKVYNNTDVHALTDISLSIGEGEVFALLGPNGAGKTTLISIICGLTNKTSGTITVGGYDTVTQYRQTRQLIGLVPQELHLDPFITVAQTCRDARGLFGKHQDEKLLSNTLKQLSLWEKRDATVQTLSGGMKRRVLIAKALMNEPKILFLDEPTAGVDVALRTSMWELVRKLKAKGTTIILTTHYIEEAQEMADTIGIIAQGKITTIAPKEELMKKLGSKELQITLINQITVIPEHLNVHHLSLSDDGYQLTYEYKKANNAGITTVLTDIEAAGLEICDIATKESSLEEIFVNLISDPKK